MAVFKSSKSNTVVSKTKYINKEVQTKNQIRIEDPNAFTFISFTLNRLLLFTISCLIAVWIIGIYRFSSVYVIGIIAILVHTWKEDRSNALKYYAMNLENKILRKKALSSAESAEWLNIFFNRWWVSNANSIFSLLKQTIDPLIAESKPHVIDIIEISEFTLGDNMPHLRNLRVYDYDQNIKCSASCDHISDAASQQQYHAKTTSVILEADLHYCSQDSCFALTAKFIKKKLVRDLN
ncbi:uncharacterized protein TRIADDRAFT_51925 [Trichoplax adhaerens]|uniref:SMP-LTD domain-containing protein n=1 Tax=Trichoplax adhaerens TaxID=10228 RepID=B3RL92_TRIAD|nr:hypothetical protein TRIADDRAFT_51925 [Trichoplax adhaerens]EDV28724.1 hypothetical protein TRIADDRAFT_51925 [Trichoplax adhaerens]|eukprot:XP_002107926.1 hypothetical protein TRIADDRAFT_51925 [Trichoplax adhaerens]